MTDLESRWCVLLPCSGGERWAVPQNTLGEIVTIQDASEQPPAQISWRGVQVPVMDRGAQSGTAWRDEDTASGLLAVFLGLQDEGCDYWALALRGAGLASQDINSEAVEDSPQDMLPDASAAFRMADQVYQVPDLLALQRSMAAQTGPAEA